MFVVNDDKSIYATRGDIVFFTVSAEDDGKAYTFQAGDVLRIKVYGKKDAEDVVLQKDFAITDVTQEVEIYLTKEDTKIGDVISKPKDYWYEVVLNDDTHPQTIIGYDEDGAKVFKLFPEGDDIEEYEPTEEEIGVVDEDLDMTSTRPVQNQAIARAFTNLEEGYEKVYEAVAEKFVTPQMFGAIGDGESDDTIAIQECIYANNVVFFPKGEYKITEPLEIPSGRTIEGDNKYCTKIICEGCDAVHFAENAERGNIRGISFWGDETDHNVFVFNNNAHLTFSDVWVRNFGGTYFYANGNGHNNNIIIQNSEFEYGGASCIEMIGTSTNQINNVTIRNCNISNFTEDGVRITGNNVSVESCTIQALDRGIVIDPTLSGDIGSVNATTKGYTIFANYFELVRKNYVYVYAYHGDQLAYVGGISIIGNYAAVNSNADASFIPVTFGVNSLQWYPYSPDGGGMIAGVFYAGNQLDPLSKGVLIDGGGCLNRSCVFLADGFVGNNRGLSTQPFTLENMGSALINNKLSKRKSKLKLYNGYYPPTSTVTETSVTLEPNTELYCEVKNDGVISIDITFNGSTDGYSLMQLYAHLKTGEVVELREKYVQGSETVVNGDGILHATADGSIYSEAIDSFEIIIKANANTLKVYNPIVTCVG